MHLFLARTPQLRRPDGEVQPLAGLDAALLAWLALEGPTGRDRLARLLWPEAETPAARSNLRQRLFQLRRQHGDALVTGRANVALAAGISHDLGDAHTVLGALPSEAPGEFAHWLDEQRRGRRDTHVARLAAAADAAEQRGELDEAIVHARAALDADRTSEAAHRRVMRLHYAAGDRAAALLAFDMCEATLKDDVGARPSHETLELLRLIERSAAPASAAAPPEPGGATATAALPVRRRVVPAAVLRPPRIVGRDAEWQRLEQAWRERRFVAVIGEAGLGKTRLVGDFGASHGRVLAAGARPGDERVVYASASRLLRQLPRPMVDALPPAVRSELARLLPELGEAAPIASAEERTRFFNAVASALSAADTPFDAIVFDDLHFADDASVELLAYVAGDSRLPWIVAARPAEVSAPGRALLDDFLGPPEAVRIVLAPLDVAQVRDLLASLELDGVDAEAEAPALHARTGGNPLFLLETLKLGFTGGGAGGGALALVRNGQSGVASRHRGGVHPASPRGGVPASVAALIERRIGRLSHAAVQLARCAAVATPDFGIELAARVLGLRTLELADPWAELEAAQVLTDGAFAHDLIYESALASVPAPVARQLHAEVAAFLVERGGEPARIAAHWLAAADDARALDALRAAAEVAWRAMRLREQCDLLQRAAEIASRIGRPSEAFEALHGWWHTMRILDRTGIDLAFHDRLDAAAHTAEQRTEAMLARSITLREAGRLAECAQVAEAAAALARAERLPELEAKAVTYSAGCASLIGDFDRAVRLLRTALPWVIADGSPEAQTAYFNDLGCCLDNANEVVEAEVFHRRAIGVARSIAAYDRAALSGANLAANRRSVGAMREALEALQQARRDALAIDAALGVTWPIELHTFTVLRDLARYADALRAGELLLQAMGQNPSMVVAGHAHLACLWIHLGQPARAHRSLDAARDLPTLPFLKARLAQLDGRLQVAQGLPAQAHLQLARERVATGGRGSLAMLIELDATLTDPPADALAAAQRVLTQAASRGLAGVALVARARAARHAAAVGDGQLAARLAGEALATPADVGPDDTYRGELWLCAAIAFEAAGLEEEARAATLAGACWVDGVAEAHVPAEFRAGFLERNPVNRALMARRARLA